MHSAVLAVAVGILVIVAYEDVRTRRIPNALSLATAALGLARVAFAAEVIDAGYTLAAAIIIFSITFTLFQRGAIGGGDAKILPCYSTANRLSRVARLPLFDEPLWRSARARHSRGGKARSVLQTFPAGGIRVVKWPERPRSSSIKGVGSALWGRGRHCWRDYADSSKVNSRARENDTYSVVFCLTVRRCDSRLSRAAAAH
jgi:hypothetical protein